MTYGTPMHHCPDGPALTSDSSKRRRATHRSPSPRTPTRTCLTMSLTTSPPRSTRSTTPLAQLAADTVWPHFGPIPSASSEDDVPPKPVYSTLSCINNRVARAGIEPATFRFSGGRSYRLSYLARAARHPMPRHLATLTGLEPATSAVTGRRANQLRHRALLCDSRVVVARTPYGIRTRATALKGRRPRPLDEGGQAESLRGTRNAVTLGALHSLGYRRPNAQTRTGPAAGAHYGTVNGAVPHPPEQT